MGGHNERKVKFATNILNNRKNCLCICRIEITGRLICNDELGRINQSPSNSNPLLFTTGKLGRLVAFSMRKPYFIKQLLRCLLGLTR